MIVDALHKVGAGRSIVIDENNEVLAGNATIEAAGEAGITKLKVVEATGDEIVAVRRTGLTTDQKRDLAIYDNRTGELAEWDVDQLLHDVEAGIDLSSFFQQEELDDLLAKVVKADGQTDPDVVPDTRETDIVRGDLFTLGQHTLLCGDTTSPADVGKVLGDADVDVVFTSPPYALGASVKINGNKAMASGGTPYLSHDDSSEAWPALMDGWWRAVMPHAAAAVVNLQLLAGNKRELCAWVAASDRVTRLADVLVWDKGVAQPAMAAHVLNPRYEHLYVFGPKDATRSIPFSSWRGVVDNIYEGPPQRSNVSPDVHAATMPSHLPTWVLTVLCDRARTVLDPFAGTGTTLIAAEQAGRRCYGIEIEPVYCQIIIDRWEAYTGSTAVKVDTAASKSGV